MSIEDRLVFISIDEVTTPKDGQVALKDRWWIHRPEKGLLFFKVGKRLVPQCNRSETVALAVRKRLYPDDDVVRIWLTFVDP